MNEHAGTAVGDISESAHGQYTRSSTTQEYFLPLDTKSSEIEELEIRQKKALDAAKCEPPPAQLEQRYRLLQRCG